MATEVDLLNRILTALNTSSGGAAGATSANQTNGAQKTQVVGSGAAALMPDAAALGDADANPTTSKLGAALMLWSGSWARAKGGLTAIQTTFTGIMNVIPMALYRVTPPTRTDGQGGTLEADSTGNLRIGEQYQPGYEDNAANVAKVEERYNSTYITGTGTTVVKSGAGYCDAITIGTPTAGTVTIYDNTAASGTIIAKLTLVAGMPFSVPIHYAFVTGLTVVVATASQDVRIGWR